IAHRFVLPREARRSPAFSRRTYAVLVPVSRGYPPRQGRSRCITHPSATRHPQSKLCCAAVRLACVRHAASVQSEPGSNSSLKFSTTRGLSIFLKRDPNRLNSLLTFFRWDACIAWTGHRPASARRPHNSPVHTVKDPTTAELSARGHFVPV